jgi:hypothetical protein
MLSAEINIALHDRYPKTVMANTVIDNLNLIARSMRNMVISSDPQQGAYFDALYKLIDFQEELMEHSNKGIQETYRSATIVMFTLVGVALILGTGTDGDWEQF